MRRDTARVAGGQPAGGRGKRPVTIAQSAIALLWIVYLAAGGAHGLSAHPGATTANPEGKTDAAREAAATPANAVVLPPIEGPSPWSEAPVLNAPGRFHIAILSDRTGGHRPGIWTKGVQAVNLLRPDFVISIGDLIEGYTEDRAQVETEWREFLQGIDQMAMKFFFVAGNHDLTNPMMHEVWRQHFGPEWYSFDYQGVHFVCLCSEDPQTTLGEEQLAWLEADLRRHEGARWTLLFLHKPLWAIAQREMAAGHPDPTGWTRVEAMLGSRSHTVFAGHTHQYVQYDRNGAKFYQLATTGGSSALRGAPYGEFDHVVWLTMEHDGPRIANVLLDGILRGEVVTEQSIARFRAFLAGVALEVAPIWVDDDAGFSRGRIDLRLTNGFDTPIELTGRIDGLPLRGLTLDPAQLALVVEPGETAALALAIRFAQPVVLPSLDQTRVTAQIKTRGAAPPLAAEWSVPITIDRKYPLPARSAPVRVDGALEEWQPLRFASGEQPVVFAAAENWQGPADAAVAFSVAHDKMHFYLAARIVDDKLVKGDGVELWLDARPLAARAQDQRLVRGTYTFRTGPPRDGQPPPLQIDARGTAVDRASCRAEAQRTADGYAVELALPIGLVHAVQGPGWRGVQLTVVVRDVDEPGQPAACIAWRGTRELNVSNAGYGQFVREEADGD